MYWKVVVSDMTEKVEIMISGPLTLGEFENFIALFSTVKKSHPDKDHFTILAKTPFTSKQIENIYKTHLPNLDIKVLKKGDKDAKEN